MAKMASQRRKQRREFVQVVDSRPGSAAQAGFEEDRRNARNRTRPLQDEAGEEAGGLEEARSSQPLQWIVWLFLAIAVASLLGSGISAAITARGLLQEKTAQGRVVDLIRRTDSEGWVYTFPVIEYPLPGYGRITVQVNEGSSPPAFTIGEPVTVRYHPDRPESARIQSTGSMIAAWTLTIIFGVLGLAFWGATFLVRWILKPAAPE